ncbi:ABC transporter ATP-binding protein [Chitinimonas koreensis]|uniref:ABC transporter ATP-binding protein n=1 Tax=Chitinimonas koreensis TaxID=356302 RepID=UPI000426AE37|nr:ABC transporter ATP-binding protein [Chitinimonas koreensis]QNM98312.1 ABC transporter ATP-binding protein [Chitinimonas koreensis]
MNAPAAGRIGLPALLTRRLTLRVRERTLLAPLEAALPAGRLTALVGPNGAGKSTLLRLLAGLQPPSGGEVQLHGLPLAALTPAERARRIGWLAQFPPQTLPLSLAEYLMLGRRPALGSFGRPGPDDRRRVEAALAAFDLAHLAGRPWRTLSGGERQRAGLARLLVQDAPIWLLDEPTNHLDLKHQALLFRRLRQEVAAGRTIVAVLHDLAQAVRWADHALLLGNGRLLAAGPPAEALAPDLLARAYDWPVTLWRSDEGHWQVAVGEAN